jgi:tetratricopeptide (TPR) repeat protein
MILLPLLLALLLPGGEVLSTPDPAPEVREIPLVFVTDAGFRAAPGWRGLVAGAAEDATADLPEAVGLRFVPSGELTWEPQGSFSSLADALDDAMEAVGSREGIVVVLVGQPLIAGTDPEAGYAYLGEPALLICMPEVSTLGFGLARRRQLASLLRHELGHVFGIPHLSGNNVMNAAPDRRAADFGELGWDILRANRNMDLGSGIPFLGSDLITLRDVYSILTGRGEMETSLLVNLAVAFEREGEPEEAVPLYELALARQRDSRPGKLGLARTSLALGDTARARELAEEMTRLADGDPALARGLGTLWLQLGENGAAEAEFSLAIANGGDGYYPRFKRGLARFGAARFEEAVLDYEAALAFEETPQAWFNLALALDACGKREAGIAALETCLTFDADAGLREAAERYLRSWSKERKDPAGG